jgi:hypothetical protein
MARYMETSVVISGTLLSEVEKIIDRDKTTLEALINEGLAGVIEKRKQKQEPFKLRDASFGKNELQPEFAQMTINHIIDKLRKTEM